MPLVSISHVPFTWAQLIATMVSMLFNYTVNNTVTYYDKRLRGAAFWGGFILFSILCAVGILGNIGVASIIHQRFAEVFYIVPAIAGALVTVVWNYVATNVFVWGRSSR